MIENLLAEVEAGTLDLVEVQRLTVQGNTWFIARAEVAAAPNLRIWESGDTAHQAVRRLWNHLEEAYLDEPDPMEPDWAALARDAEGEHPRHDAEEPEVQ